MIAAFPRYILIHFGIRALYPTLYLKEKIVTSACGIQLDLPDLPDTVSCSISTTCTGVTCCVYSEEVGKNFQVLVDIDSCAMVITVELEQMKFEIPFKEYLWGMASVIVGLFIFDML